MHYVEPNIFSNTPYICHRTIANDDPNLRLKEITLFIVPEKLSMKF